MLVCSGLIEYVTMVSRKQRTIFDTRTNASRKPAILVEPQLSRCILFMSKILSALLSSLLLLGLLAKCFKMHLQFSYIDLASIWLLFTDMHNLFILPAEAWESS